VVYIAGYTQLKAYNVLYIYVCKSFKCGSTGLERLTVFIAKECP
jgi:hypothetical protein